MKIIKDRLLDLFDEVILVLEKHVYPVIFYGSLILGGIIAYYALYLGG